MSQAADSDLDFNPQTQPFGQEIGDVADQTIWPKQLAEPVTSLQSSFADPPLPYLKLLHAEPLMPMQERDLAAMRDLFGQEGIEAIEADIHQNLSHYRPELPWEDWDMMNGHAPFARF